MNQKFGKDSSESNIIHLINSSKKSDEKTISTIAAIIAIKIEHPKDSSPEEFLIDLMESSDNIEILAFADALENEHIGITSNEARDDASNDA